MSSTRIAHRHRVRPGSSRRHRRGAGCLVLADLDEHADEFGRKIYGIEAGSPGNETIQRRSTRTPTAGRLELVESGTPAMLAQVEKSTKAGEPIVFLGWSPHWMTVSSTPCSSRTRTAVWGGAGEIRTLTRAGFADDDPADRRFLQN